MKKFKVLGGNHVQNDKVYEKGEIVKTELPLDQMFANKFEFLGEFEEAPAKKATAKKPTAKPAAPKKETPPKKEEEPSVEDEEEDEDEDWGEE